MLVTPSGQENGVGNLLVLMDAHQVEPVGLLSARLEELDFAISEGAE